MLTFTFNSRALILKWANQNNPPNHQLRTYWEGFPKNERRLGMKNTLIIYLCALHNPQVCATTNNVIPN